MTATHSSLAPSLRFRGRLGRRMLVLLLPLIIVPVLLMGYVAYQRAQTLLLKQAEEQIDTLEDSLRSTFETWLLVKSVRLDRALRRVEARQALGYLLTHPRFSPAFADSRRRLLDALATINATETSPVFNAYYLIIDDQVVVASRPEQEGLRLDQEPLASLLKALPHAEDFTLHRVLSQAPPLTKQPALVTLRHVQVGGKVGVLVGMSYGLPLERIILTAQSALPEARAFLISSDDTWLYLDPHEQRLIAAPLPSSVATTFHNLLDTPSTYPDTTVELQDGDSQLLGVLTVFPKSQSGLYAAQPREVVLAQINSLIPFTIGLLGVTAAFLALVILGVTRSITRPVLEMARTAEHLAQGDLRIRFPVNRDDELGILAHAFNHMADQLSDLYRSLELKVEERTQQVRTAAEVASLATSATRLDDILRRTVELIVERFPQYYHASVFLLDENGEYAVLRESTGPVGEEMKRRGHRLQVGGQSLVGWATAHNQPRIASDVTEDPIHFRNPLLPETRSEAAIPIAVGPHVLGALDVQSKDPHAFDEEAITTLHTLANQLAAAIYNVRLLEQTRFSLEETETLYQVSRHIAQAETEGEVHQWISEALKRSAFISALLLADPKGESFHLLLAHHPTRQVQPPGDALPINTDSLTHLFPSRAPLFVPDLSQPPAGVPEVLLRLPQHMGCHSVAYLPIFRGGKLVALFALGVEDTTTLTTERLQPYLYLAEVATTALEKLHALENAQLRLHELQTLNLISQALSRTLDLNALYRTLDQELRDLFGEVGFAVAIYHPTEQRIEVPYLREQGSREVTTVEAFPLGEGLVSLVIQRQRPLLLVHDTEAQARALGAKIIGRPARSWMGAPLIVGDEVLGALVVQDLEREGRFDEDDLRLFTTLAAQVALVLRNVRLLEESRRRAERERWLAQMTTQIRRANEVRRILEIASAELQRALGARRARIRPVRPASTASRSCSKPSRP